MKEDGKEEKETIKRAGGQKDVETKGERKENRR